MGKALTHIGPPPTIKTTERCEVCGHAISARSEDSLARAAMNHVAYAVQLGQEQRRVLDRTKW